MTSDRSVIWQQRRQPSSVARQGDHRTPYQRDKARILHSASFRRLQAKTQVLGVGLNDFYRTRLTHSLEVAQIGVGINSQLQQKYAHLQPLLQFDNNLIESICLAHDLGHPPFGHGGEVALNVMMHQHGGFEGNGQTFRLVTHLESYSAAHGMNLTRRTLLGLLKYPALITDLTSEHAYPALPADLKRIKTSEWRPPKGLFSQDADTFDWVLSACSVADIERFRALTKRTDKHSVTRYKSFDCSIMELADDIAYGIHDLEDALVLGLTDRAAFEGMVTTPIKSMSLPLSEHIESITDALFSGKEFLRKNAIGELVNSFIVNICITPQECFDEPLLDFQAKLDDLHQQALSCFKQYVMQDVILRPELQLIEYKSQQVMFELMRVYSHEPNRLLPRPVAQRWNEQDSTENQHRVLCDYFAGMTDEHATRLYSRLFMPKSVTSIEDLMG